MRIDLESEEARFLHAELERRLEDLEADVEHADDRTTQRAILDEIAKLESIVKHLDGALELSFG
jgi:hypothetical protein